MKQMTHRLLVGDRNETGVVLGLALILVGAAAVLVAQGSVAFEPFLGSFPPVLAIIIATFVAIPCINVLVQQHGFSRNSRQQTRRGLPVAVLCALAFGIAVIAADLGLRYPEGINVEFPQSLLFYPVIGFFVDLVFHAILPALLLVLQRPLIRWLGNRRMIWAAIVLAALVEPILQVAWAESLSWTELYTAISVFLFGVTQLAIIRRYGFFAMVGMRWTYYLIWHIVWGYFRLMLLF